MEIVILFFIWILVLYIIKLNKEIYQLKHRIVNNKEIYVPTLNEIIQGNIWYLQLYRLITNQFRERKELNIQLQQQLIQNRKIRVNNLATLSDDGE